MLKMRERNTDLKLVDFSAVMGRSSPESGFNGGANGFYQFRIGEVRRRFIKVGLFFEGEGTASEKRFFRLWQWRRRHSGGFEFHRFDHRRTEFFV